MTATVRCHDCRAPLALITRQALRLHPTAVADAVTAHRQQCQVGALHDIAAIWAGRGLR